MKIIAYPFAGGSKYSFNYLKEYLDATDLEFIALDYPGRGQRMQEALAYNTTDVIQSVLQPTLNIIKNMNPYEDYVLYGHSMGGLIAYLMAIEIETKGYKKPLKLMVSGRKAPTIIRKERIAHLESNAFWNKVNELGGLPDQILKEKGLRDFYEDILKADYQVVETYKNTQKHILSIPIDVLYGTEEIDDLSEVTAWRDATSSAIELHALEGNHFFIYQHPEFMINLFQKETNIFNSYS